MTWRVSPRKAPPLRSGLYRIFKVDKRSIGFYHLGKVDEILEKGILLDTQVSEKTSGNKKGSTQFMHYLYTPVSIDGAPFIAKLAVEEYGPPGASRAYNLQRIQLSALSRAQFSDLILQNREKYAYSADALNIAQLFDFVKQQDKTFNPNPSSQIVDAKGKPITVYHGTNSRFSTYQSKEYRVWCAFRPRLSDLFGDAG